MYYVSLDHNLCVLLPLGYELCTKMNTEELKKCTSSISIQIFNNL
jgi:hypothetical protein